MSNNRKTNRKTNIFPQKHNTILEDKIDNKIDIEKKYLQDFQ